MYVYIYIYIYIYTLTVNKLSEKAASKLSDKTVALLFSAASDQITSEREASAGQ